MEKLFTFILIKLGLGAILLFINNIMIFESIFFSMILYALLSTNVEWSNTIIILVCIVSALASIGLQRTKIGFFLLAPTFSLFWGWWFSYLMFTDAGNAGEMERYIVLGVITLTIFGLHMASYQRVNTRKKEDHFKKSMTSYR